MSSKGKNINNISTFFQDAFIGLNNYVNSLKTIYNLVDGETLAESLPILGTIMVGYLTCVYGITTQYNTNIGLISTALFNAKTNQNNEVSINEYNYSKKQINKAYYQTMCISTFILFSLIIILNKYIKKSSKGKSKRLKNLGGNIKNIYKDVKKLGLIENALHLESLDLNRIRNNDQILSTQGKKKRTFKIDPDIGNPKILNSKDRTINILHETGNPVI